MRLRTRFVLAATYLGACAAPHAATRPARATPAGVPAAERPAPQDPDADGDGVLNPADACPLEPGPAGGGGCPEAYGAVFLRVLDAETRAPVAATLVFTPNVNRVIGEDDGYAGTLAPGDYVVTAEAPGYTRAMARFSVAADAKSTLVLTLRRAGPPAPP
jgi:hypothetical protein